MGRLFAESEVNNRQHLALVNETFVRARLEGRDALGRTVRIPRLRQPPIGIDDDSFQIVGVVKDTLNRSLTDQVMPEIYLPFTLLGFANRVVTLTQADPADLSRAVMSQVYAIDKDQPVTDVRTIETALNDGVYSGPRFNLILLTVFAGLGLALAIIGVYGVISNSVAQQTHDIGVRMAIGATRGHIIRMIVARGSRLLLAGVALGLAGGFFGARLLSRQIWKVSPFDPVSFGVVSLILFVAGILACLWPARRAARVEPMEALRYE
jgi:putative ABC transport system permease protein